MVDRKNQLEKEVEEMEKKFNDELKRREEEMKKKEEQLEKEMKERAIEMENKVKSRMVDLVNTGGAFRGQAMMNHGLELLKEINKFGGKNDNQKQAALIRKAVWKDVFQ